MINRLPEKFLAEAWPHSKPPQSAGFDLQAESQKLFDRVEKLVREHPGACVAGAFFIGACVAWWMKRR